MILRAITRAVSPALANCELTHLIREAIDARIAAEQHRQYEECLATLGCRIHRLPAEPDLPDSVFVEDTAIVLDELAIITRPGAASRQPETTSIARALAPYRKLVHISAPGTIDGGDVLRIDRTIYVGISGRSNEAGVGQMSSLLEPFGYTVKGVPVAGCLHLKTAVTLVAHDTLLVNPDWVEAQLFGKMRVIETDRSEPFAANALLVGATLIYPAGFPATQKRLEDDRINVVTVTVTELARAEGGVTCCSLIFSA